VVCRFQRVDPLCHGPSFIVDAVDDVFVEVPQHNHPVTVADPGW